MSELPAWLVKRLKEAPDRPGCYLMVDGKERVVYVGKALSLRKRLQQYFRPKSHDTRFFVGLLESILARIDLIVSQNDKEAYILEDSLIKRHLPRFNIRLKDDKSFLHIRLDRSVTWPRLEVMRRPREESGDLFGPYASASSIRKTLDVVNRHFQLRTCTDSEFKIRRRPCLEHQIGRCPAPCVLEVEPGGYAANVEEVRLFLSGRGRDLIGHLEKQMAEAAEGLRFETAAGLRDRIAAIKRSLTPQSISFTTRRPMDAIGLYREGAQGSVDVLRVREGVLADVESYPQPKQELPSTELIEDFIRAYYETHPIPDTILVAAQLADAAGLSAFLSERKGGRTRVSCPKRGEKRRLVDLACANAKETMRATFGEGMLRDAVLVGLKSRLGLSMLPRRIECYDISNIQGTEPVASMVVALDGALDKKAYRSFRIRSGDTPDDYRMMAEVLRRRLVRGVKEEALPDLIVLDGGRGQLGVASRILGELAIEGVELASLAKERIEDEAGHIATSGRSKPSSRGARHRPDRVFRPERKNAIHLPANSNELFLLQRLRDEAHRFALKYHKKLRRRRTLTSRLLQIEGVGPTRLKALLKHFGSLKALKAASAEDITQCPGLGQETARRIKRELQV